MKIDDKLSEVFDTVKIEKKTEIKLSILMELL